MSLQQKRSTVVTGSRKRFQKGAVPPPSDSPGKRLQDAQASVKISTAPVPQTIPVYDAGGGKGHEGLKFNTLNAEQVEMYKRTLNSTVIEDENLEQETRQLGMKDEYLTYIVNISREDFPSKSADIEVRFTHSALQASWSQFLVDARKALDVEFIEMVVDRKDGAPVNRMLGLRNGGKYFLRQREASAIMEVIQSGELPEQVSWQVTSGINIAKDNLKESGVYQGTIDEKIDYIINQPMLREQQRHATYKILEAENAKQVVDAMWEVLNSHDLPPEEYKIAMEVKMKKEREQEKKEKERQERLAHLVATGGSAKEILELSKGAKINAEEEEGFGSVSTKTHDREVDIVSLFRLSFETFSRLAMKDPSQIVTICDTAIDFVEQTMVKYRHEVDIVVLASAMCSNLEQGMVPHRKRVYHLIMDNIQAYAPPNDSFRPARVVRRLLSPMEATLQDEEWERSFLPMSKEERDREANERQTKLQNQVRIVGGEEEEFDLEAYLREIEEKKRKAAEEAEAARLAALAAMQEEVEEEEVVDTGPKKKVKKPWGGSIGQVGKLKPEEVKYASIYDDEPDDGKPRKQLLKGYKPFSGARPLPDVPGIMFRGLIGPYKSDMAMLQCFASLYAFIKASFGNREDAFELAIQEEVCTIGLVSIGNPRIMEYTIWIIDSMYGDAFMTEEDEEATIAATANVSALDGTGDEDKKDYARNLPKDKDPATAEPSVEGGGSSVDDLDSSKKSGSASPSKSKPKGEGSSVGGDKDDASTIAGNDNNTAASPSVADDDSLNKSLGMVIDCASTITQPTVDLEGKNNFLKENLDVNMGDPDQPEDPDDPIFPEYKKKDPNDPDWTEIVVDGEEKERQAREKKKQALIENSGLKMAMGENQFEIKYKRRPRDPIVLFAAMVSCHCDMQEHERDLGRKWIGLWDDASDHFKRLKVIGEGLSGLT